MKSIQVYDPALCCSSGVCGVDVDQELIQFSADADWAKQNGVSIERFNLAQQSWAFAESATVRTFLETFGPKGLPLILVDGQIAFAGRYPSRADLIRLAGAGKPISDAKVASEPKVNSCCNPNSGCC